jgi:hypothetical protein
VISTPTAKRKKNGFSSEHSGGWQVERSRRQIFWLYLVNLRNGSWEKGATKRWDFEMTYMILLHHLFPSGVPFSFPGDDLLSETVALPS